MTNRITITYRLKDATTINHTIDLPYTSRSERFKICEKELEKVFSKGFVRYPISRDNGRLYIPLSHIENVEIVDLC